MAIDTIVSRIRSSFGYHPDPKSCARSIEIFERSTIPIINPSLTTLQFLAEDGMGFLLVDQARRAVRACAGSLHLDFFDENYVNTGGKGSNIGILTPNLANYIVQEVGAPLDTHFMVRPSTLGGERAFRKYIGRFIGAGASFISVHHGAFCQDNLEEKPLLDFFSFVRDKGANVGLAINPDEDTDCLFRYEGKIDFALVMSVIPGAGGRGFDDRALTNIRILRELAFQPLIEVDGAVSQKTIKPVTDAGGQWNVVGSAWFGSPKTVDELRSEEQMHDVYESLRQEWSHL